MDGPTGFTPANSMKNWQIICSLVAEDSPEFFARLKRADALDLSMIEIRLDPYYPNHTLIETNGLIRRISAETSRRLLWTLRTDDNPDKCSSQQYSWMLRILDKDRRFYDLEINRINDLDFTPDFSRVVLSYHNFEQIPEDYSKIIEKMAEYHPWIVKTACFSENLEDIFSMISSLQKLERDQEKIGLVMSQAGYLTRLFYQDFGFDYTFCCLDTPTAPGQVSYDELKTLNRLLRKP